MWISKNWRKQKCVLTLLEEFKKIARRPETMY